MKTSIALASYNGEKYILEQLESFSRQSVIPDEVVITDDGSTDNTLKVINEFRKSSPFPVRVYSNNSNLGYTQNFSKAMQLCNNKLIFLSDQDDVWFPGKLEYMINLAATHYNKDVFLVDAELTNENLQCSGLTKQGQIKSAGLDKGFFVMGCCLAVRKSFLDRVMPIPLEWRGHDDWIVNIADFLDLRITDDAVFQLYRIHGENTSKFVANQLTKPNRLKIFGSCFIATLNVSHRDNLLKRIQSSRIMLNCIEGLFRYENYRPGLMRAKRIFDKDLKILDKRYDINTSGSILSGIRSAIKLYIDGGYKQSRGFASALYDVFWRR